MGANISQRGLSNSNEGYSNESVRIQKVLNSSNPRIVEGKLNPKFLSIGNIKGEKFKLTPAELKEVMPLLEQERAFFREHLGEEFLDRELRVSHPLSPAYLIQLLSALYIQDMKQ